MLAEVEIAQTASNLVSNVLVWTIGEENELLATYRKTYYRIRLSPHTPKSPVRLDIGVVIDREVQTTKWFMTIPAAAAYASDQELAIRGLYA